MLKVKNITKYYDELCAVDNLSFNVDKGEIFGLLGVNGAGKTTTFRIIMSLLDKDNGEVTFNGKKIDYNVTDKIGFLTEERSLLSKLTVFEQADLYGHLKGLNKEKIEKRLEELLNTFKISEYKNKKIKELSKGNQQKIQFILAILNEPELLILDEPFSGLDPINVDLFRNVILKLKEKGTTIIFSTHRMDHVEYFCDSLVVLVKGEEVLKGKLSKIKKDYRKKNVRIIGDVDKEELLDTKGVLNVEKVGNEYIVKIEDDLYVDTLFKYVSKCKNVSKFNVEEPSLNEIFIEKVGESYGK